MSKYTSDIEENIRASNRDEKQRQYSAEFMEDREKFLSDPEKVSWMQQRLSDYGSLAAWLYNGPKDGRTNPEFERAVSESAEKFDGARVMYLRQEIARKEGRAVPSQPAVSAAVPSSPMMLNSDPSPEINSYASSAKIGSDPVWIPADAERGFGDVQKHTIHTKQGDTVVYEVSVLDRRTGKQVDMLKTDEPMQLIHYRDPTGREVQVLQRIDPSRGSEIIQAKEAVSVTRDVYTDVERKRETTTEVKTVLQPESPESSNAPPKHDASTHHAAPAPQPRHDSLSNQHGFTRHDRQAEGMPPSHAAAHSAAHGADAHLTPAHVPSLKTQTLKPEAAHALSEPHKQVPYVHPNQHYFAGKTYQLPISPYAVVGQMIADMAHHAHDSMTRTATYNQTATHAQTPIHTQTSVQNQIREAQKEFAAAHREFDAARAHAPKSLREDDVLIISNNPGDHAQIIGKVVNNIYTHQAQNGHTVVDHRYSNHPELGIIDGKYVPQNKEAHGSSTVRNISGVTVVNNLQEGERVVGTQQHRSNTLTSHNNVINVGVHAPAKNDHDNVSGIHMVARYVRQTHHKTDSHSGPAHNNVVMNNTNGQNYEGSEIVSTIIVSGGRTTIQTHQESTYHEPNHGLGGYRANGHATAKSNQQSR